MRIRYPILAAALAIFAHALCSAMSATDYVKVRDEEGLRLYVNGVGTGYMWANASLVEDGKPPLFCQPIGLPPANFLEVVDRKLDAMRKSNTFKESTTIELALLYGLKDAFPCRKQ